MEYWIIGDNHALSQRIRNSLLQLGLQCPDTHLVTLAAAKHLPRLSEIADGIVFIAIPTIGDSDIEFIWHIRSVSKARLVVVSSAADNSTVMNAIRAGVVDFLDAGQDLSNEISSCLARIERGCSRPKPKAHTISIVPCHVSSDASILATNVAAAIATKVENCCLLDLQLRGGDLALLLKLQPKHSIYDLISQPQAIDDAMLRQALAAHESGIQLLAGPHLFSDLRNIDPNACKDIVLRAQRLFSHVVIATEDIQHSEQMHALIHSSRIVLTMRPDLLSLHRAKQHIDFMITHDIVVEQLLVAVMGVGLPAELPLSAIKKVLNGIAIHTVPDDSTALTLSVNVGNPIVIESPRSPASRGIVKLVGVLTGQDNDALNGQHESVSTAKAAAFLALSSLPFCK